MTDKTQEIMIGIMGADLYAAWQTFKGGRVTRVPRKIAYLTAADGEKQVFVSITSSGQKLEDEPLILFRDKKEAIDKWLQAALAYAEGKAGTLYWRTSPSICSFVISDGTELWTVHSRILITDAELVEGEALS